MIGILLIATGGDRYTDFIPPLFASLRTFFPPHEVVLFTNNGDIRHHINVVMVDNLGWPRATLMRYHTFLKHQNILSKYSHLFYMDVDMLVKSPIRVDEICGNGITAVLHPGFVGQPYKAYCRNRNSTAFIEGSDGEYYQGCFVGGSTKEFLDMSRTIRDNVDMDDSKGVTPEWFDEAHLNRYLYCNPPAITLPSTFAYPQISDSYPCVHGKAPRIIHLSKDGQENWK